jgi:hypothetical protein
VARLLTKQKFAGDQPSLDGLAEPNIVSNEQVHSREPEGLAQRFELIRIETNAGAKWALQIENAAVGVCLSVTVAVCLCPTGHGKERQEST